MSVRKKVRAMNQRLKDRTGTPASRTANLSFFFLLFFFLLEMPSSLLLASLMQTSPCVQLMASCLECVSVLEGMVLVAAGVREEKWNQQKKKGEQDEDKVEGFVTDEGRIMGVFSSGWRGLRSV